MNLNVSFCTYIMNPVLSFASGLGGQKRLKRRNKHCPIPYHARQFIIFLLSTLVIFSVDLGEIIKLCEYTYLFACLQKFNSFFNSLCVPFQVLNLESVKLGSILTVLQYKSDLLEAT